MTCSAKTSLFCLLLLVPAWAFPGVEGQTVGAMVGSSLMQGGDGHLGAMVRVVSPRLGVHDELPGGVAFIEAQVLVAPRFSINSDTEYSAYGGMAGVYVNLFRAENPRQAGLSPVIWLGGYHLRREQEAVGSPGSPDGPDYSSSNYADDHAGRLAAFIGFHVAIPAPDPDWGGLRLEFGMGTIEDLSVRLNAELTVRVWRGLALTGMFHVMGDTRSDDVQGAPAPDNPQPLAGASRESTSGSVLDPGPGGWAFMLFGATFTF